MLSSALLLLSLPSASADASYLARGPRGFRGAVGPDGVRGAQGPRQPALGVQGSQGVAGPQGAAGATGSLGPLGPMGNQGAQGFQGVQGPQGYQGYQGSVGHIGAQGATGAIGNQGAPGATGLTGAQGAQGALGFALLHHEAFVDEIAVVENSLSDTDKVSCSSACDTGCEGPFASCPGESCAANTKCRCARLGAAGSPDEKADLVAESFPSMAGMSCEFRMEAPAGVVAEVSAGYVDQPEDCRIVHTMVGGDYPGEVVESGSMMCPVAASAGFYPVTMSPEVTVKVLNGIPQCENPQAITESFDSERFARAVGGWEAKYYMNDRAQPYTADFITPTPRIELDSGSPSAVQLRYWPCSAFYYADTRLGHALPNAEDIFDVGAYLANTTNPPLFMAYNFALPPTPAESFNQFDRDEGEMFIGYFHRERGFESSVWYTSEYIGARILFPNDNEQSASTDPLLRLVAEPRNGGEMQSESVPLERGKRYRFVGVVTTGATPTFVGQVFPITLDPVTSGYQVGALLASVQIAFDGSAVDGGAMDEIDLGGRFAWNEQRPWAFAADPGVTATRDISQLKVNSFGVFHDDWSERSSTDVALEGTMDGQPDGVDQRCWNPLYREALVTHERDVQGFGDRVGADPNGEAFIMKRFPPTSISFWSEDLTLFTRDTVAAGASTAAPAMYEYTETSYNTSYTFTSRPSSTPSPAPGEVCPVLSCPTGAVELPLTPVSVGGPQSELVDEVCRSVFLTEDQCTDLTYQVGDGETDYIIDRAAFFPSNQCGNVTFYTSADGVTFDEQCTTTACTGMPTSQQGCEPGVVPNVRFVRFSICQDDLPPLNNNGKRQVPGLSLSELACCGNVQSRTSEYAVGAAAVADLVLDEVTYTIPATEGYPKQGDVLAVATCAGEVYSPGAGSELDTIGDLTTDMDSVDTDEETSSSAEPDSADEFLEAVYSHHIWSLCGTCADDDVTIGNFTGEMDIPYDLTFESAVFPSLPTYPWSYDCLDMRDAIACALDMDPSQVFANAAACVNNETFVLGLGAAGFIQNHFNNSARACVMEYLSAATHSLYEVQSGVLSNEWQAVLEDCGMDADVWGRCRSEFADDHCKDTCATDGCVCAQNCGCSSDDDRWTVWSEGDPLLADTPGNDCFLITDDYPETLEIGQGYDCAVVVDDASVSVVIDTAVDSFEDCAPQLRPGACGTSLP